MFTGRSCWRALEIEHQHLLGQGAKQRVLKAPALPPSGTKAGNSQLCRKDLSELQLNWPGFYRIKELFNIFTPALHGSAAFSFAFTQ